MPERAAMCRTATATAVGGALFVSFAADADILEFSDQLNHISAGIATEFLAKDNTDLASFNKSLTIESPNPNADLFVTTEQTLIHSTNLNPGASIVTLSASINVEGSDFFDDGMGGLFDVIGNSQTQLDFTLNDSATFDIVASAWSTLPNGFADLILFEVADDELIPVFEVGSDDQTELDTLLTLQPGTYRLDAFADFAALGPGRWSGSVGYDLTFAIIPTPGTATLFVIVGVMCGKSPGRRRAE